MYAATQPLPQAGGPQTDIQDDRGREKGFGEGGDESASKYSEGGEGNRVKGGHRKGRGKQF